MNLSAILTPFTIGNLAFLAVGLIILLVGLLGKPTHKNF